VVFYQSLSHHRDIFYLLEMIFYFSHYK